MSQFRLLSFYNSVGTEEENGFFLNKGEIKLLLNRFKNSQEIMEGLVMSDPERTEILYYAKQDLGDWIFGQIETISASGILDKKNFFQQTCDEKRCLDHLAELCFGFHPSTFGSYQRFPKFVAAYNLSCESGVNGKFIDELMNTFVATNLVIKNETNYQTANFSISYTIVDLVAEFVKKIKNPKIAIVGFNAMGKKVYSNLLKKGYSRISIVENSIIPFSNLPNIDPTSYVYEPFSQLENVVKEHDIIINTLDSPEGIISPQYFSEKLASMKIIIDLAMQGSFHDSLSQLDQVILFEMTDIYQIIEKKIELNKKCMRRVKTIVSNKMVQFRNWLDKKKGQELLMTVKKILKENNNLEEYMERNNERRTINSRTCSVPHEKNLSILKKSIDKIQANQKHGKAVTFEMAVDYDFKLN